MPAVTRVGDNNTGHDACPSVPLTAGSPDVFVNGRPVCRVGDPYAVHGCPTHTPHVPHLQQGSPNVFVNGIPVSRIGDAVHCGGAVMEGSPDVFINEMPDDSSSSGSGSSGSGNNESASGGTSSGDNASGQGGAGTTDGGTSPAGAPANAWVDDTNVDMSAAELAVRTFANLVILNSFVKFRGTDTDNLLYCLPEIAAAEAEKASNPNDRQGWLYLHDMFERWFGGKANGDALKNPNVFWVDMDWILAHIRVHRAFSTLADKSYLFSPNARQQLAEILKRDGKLPSEGRAYFDYTNEDWSQWRAGYFQQIKANGMEAFPVDGLMASMGDFQFRALAKGYTEPQENGHLIVIQGVSIIVWDSFNFDGDAELGFWRCSPPTFSMTKEHGFTQLHNGDFQKFRKDFSTGNDFMVLSRPEPVDPQVVFSYETDL